MIASLWCAAARAQHQRFAPAYVDPDPEQAAREWVDTMRTHLTPAERAACREGADVLAEQACILGVLEHRADAPPPPGPAPSPRPAGVAALPSYDVLRGCLRRPDMEPGRIARCVEEEKGAAQYLRDALGRVPPDAQARCVRSVGRADRRVLEASASLYQAMTVYCGAILAKAAD